MEESIEDIFRREDVRYYLKKRELRWKTYYKKHYGKKFVNIFYMYAMQWAKHKSAKVQVVQQLGASIKDTHFEVLMAVYCLSTTWGTDSVSHIRVFKDFFSDEMANSTFKLRIRDLVRLGLLKRVNRVSLNKVKKERINQLCSTREGLIALDGRSLLIPILYNTYFGRVTMALSREDTEFSDELTKMIGVIDQIKEELDETTKY
jgi:hypothetical protein